MLIPYHQRFYTRTGGDDTSSPPVVLTSPTVFEPTVMIPSITAGSPTGGDSPSHHQRHKSNAPRTVGDAHFEPAVMGGAGVVPPLYVFTILPNMIATK